jgi:hypothetical protein
LAGKKSIDKAHFEQAIVEGLKFYQQEENLMSGQDVRHLPLTLKEDSKAFYRRPVMPPQTQSEPNKHNHQAHGDNLNKNASALSKFWNNRRNERKRQNLPTIEGGIPFVLPLDPSTDVGFLY